MGNILDLKWYHGTNSEKFDHWQFPPPPQSPELQVQHTGIYFTTNLNFAKDAGNNIAEIKINIKAKILDTISDYKTSEKLRVYLKETNPLIASLDNINEEIWHNGWKDGSVLRPRIVFGSMIARQYEKNISKYSKEYGRENAIKIVGQLYTRGLIETISKGAKDLGFDGIYGNEIDRWSSSNEVLAQPWLCIFNKESITPPHWLEYK